jgi:hypothetical protein
MESTAVFPSARPWTTTIFQSGHHGVVARRGQRFLRDVVPDVEVGVVLPGRLGDAERRGYDLLSKARHEVQTFRNDANDVIERHAALVHGETCAMHRLVGSLEIEKRGVLGRQSRVQLMVYHGGSRHEQAARAGPPAHPVPSRSP